MDAYKAMKYLFFGWILWSTFFFGGPEEHASWFRLGEYKTLDECRIKQAIHADDSFREHLTNFNKDVLSGKHRVHSKRADSRQNYIIVFSGGKEWIQHEWLCMPEGFKPLER